jgi:alpha/beta superfamily hydrolase
MLHPDPGQSDHSPMKNYLDIDGPAGKLEIMVDQPDNAGTTWAVMCHPHPLYGGSMHDGVLEIAANVALYRNINVVRFNFRGVGRSSGTHSGGPGEADDLASVLAWLKTTHQPAKTLLCGYSFGSSIAWRVAGTTDAPGLVMLIAPPVGMMPFDAPAPACPVHAIWGDVDSFVDEEALQALPDVIQHCIEDADHFFMGCHEGLSAAVEKALS